MNGLKTLKPWQKAGLALAALHFILYSPLILFAANQPPGKSALGYLLIALEIPWVVPFDFIFGRFLSSASIGFGPYSLLLYGTVAYGIVGCILGLIYQVARRGRSPQ